MKKLSLTYKLALGAALLVGSFVLVTHTVLAGPWRAVNRARCNVGAIMHQSTFSGSVDDAVTGAKPADDNTARGQSNQDLGAAASGPNLIVNPTMEVIGSDSGLPQGWQNNILGANNAQFGYGSGHNSARSLVVSISDYKNGDADWYSPNAATNGAHYFEYRDYYRSNVITQVVVVTTDASGKASYFQLRQVPAAANWALYHDRFLIPANAVQIRVFHSLDSKGTLEIDDVSLKAAMLKSFDRGLVSLTFDDGWESVYSQALPLMKSAGIQSTQYVISGYVGSKGYMTARQLYALQGAGHEVASHSVDHLDLPAQPAKVQDFELRQSGADLNKCFGEVSNYAAPYGTYSQAVTTASAKYYRSYRTTDDGYNTGDAFDPYSLKVMNISRKTSPAELASWLETAKTNKVWLILVYHQVDGSTNNYSRSPQQFSQDLNQIKTSGLETVTVDQALDQIGKQLAR